MCLINSVISRVTVLGTGGYHSYDRMSEFFFDNRACERFETKSDEPEKLITAPTFVTDETMEIFRRAICPYCHARLDEITWDISSGAQIIDNQEISSRVCNRCGFWIHFRFACSYGQLYQWLLIAQLQTFELQSKEAPLAAIHQWLSHHPDVAHRVHHRELEMVVCDISRTISIVNFV